MARSELVLSGVDDGLGSVLGEAITGIGDLVSTIPGLGAFGAVAGVVGGAVVALDAMADEAVAVDDQLRGLVTRTGEGEAALAGYKDEVLAIRSLGIGEDFADIANEMEVVASVTRANGDELNYLTSQAVFFRDRFDKDVNETIRAADTAMELFEVSGERAFDVITAAMQRTGDPADDLLDTINEYGANFEQAGFSAELFGSVLVQSLEAGARNTDDIADGVREFQIKTLEGTDAVRDAYAALGIDANQLYDDLNNGNTTVAATMFTVIDRLRAVDNALLRNQLGAELFGTKFQDMGADVVLSLRNDVSALGDFEGAAQRAFDVATDGLANTEARADAATERIKILIGEAILPMKAAFLEGTAAVLESGAGLVDVGTQLLETQNRVKGLQEELFQAVEASEAITLEGREVVNMWDKAFVVGSELNEMLEAQGNNLATNEQMLTATQIAVDLVKGGFEGTAEALVAQALQLADVNTQMAEAIPLYGTITDKEMGLFQATTEVVVAQSTAYDATVARLASEESLTIQRENAITAEARYTEQLAAAGEAVGALQARLAGGFGRDLGIAEAGGELDGLNSTIRESLEASGAGVVALAAYEVAIGEAGEESIMAALKVQLLTEGVRSLAEGAAEDGEITRDEIAGIISGAEELKATLDAEFEFAFAESGAEGVLGTAEAIVEELETATASTYNVTLDSTAPETEENVGSLENKVTTFTNAPYLVEFSDNTLETGAEVAVLENKVTTFTNAPYLVEFQNNADKNSGAIQTLRSQAEDLAGVYTIRIRVEADPIPTLPQSGGGGGGGSEPPNGGRGGAGTALSIGTVNINDTQTGRDFQRFVRQREYTARRGAF